MKVIKEMITITKKQKSSVYLPQLDTNEADAEFVQAVLENEDDIYSISYREEVVGIAQMIHGGQAFLYIYIFPQYRSRGYGKQAVSLFEKQLHAHELGKIMTCYRSEDMIASAFAKNCGFEKEFASDYMVYSGPRFEAEIVPVRKYRDEDYIQAHSLYAEAFHVMRLSTGCFPNSVPEEPNDGMRKYWAETDNERLVYLQDDEIVAYAHIEGAEIGSVSVKLAHQGEGIGKRFVKHIVNKILAEGHEQVMLYCVVGNDCARRLYDSLGFQKVCRNDYAVKERATLSCEGSKESW